MMEEELRGIEVEIDELLNEVSWSPFAPRKCDWV